MSNVRRQLIFGICLLISACGFHPVYGSGDNNVSNQLASVRVEKIKADEGDRTDDREGQILQNTLESLLNPASSNSSATAYSLHISLKNSRREVGINKDLRVTRYDVIPNVDYQLISLDTNKVVDSGHITIKSSYNRTVSEFATYVAEQDAAQKADQELAEEIRSRLIYYFSK